MTLWLKVHVTSGGDDNNVAPGMVDLDKFVAVKERYPASLGPEETGTLLITASGECVHIMEEYQDIENVIIKERGAFQIEKSAVPPHPGNHSH